MTQLFNYDPNGKFDVTIEDVVYRRDATGKEWISRLYQPAGSGPFPGLVDVHGGVWNGGSIDNDHRMNMALAQSGVVVAAVDYRLAPDFPYPAQVADVNYSIRWLKARSEDFHVHPQWVGAMGSSSGGHTVMLNAMKPADPRYAGMPLDAEGEYDAELAFVLAMWPVLDPYARYRYAIESGQEHLKAFTEAYFVTDDTMQEGNPQLILERGELVSLPPVLLIQGTADLNIPAYIPERFVQAYRAAGGDISVEMFENMPHNFGNRDYPEADQAIELMKAFIQQQVAGSKSTV